jgi:outer membrane protein
MYKQFQTFCAGLLVIVFLSGTKSQLHANPSESTANSIPPTLSTVTFEQCLEWALKESEELKISLENIEQFKAKKNQIRGSILPDLRFKSSTIFQDTSGVESSGENDSSRSTQTLDQRTESKLNVQQPLFQGFKDQFAIKSLNADTKSAEKNVKNLSYAILGQVAEYFYGITLLESRWKDLKKLSNLLNDRVKELNQRIRLGKSRESELFTVESEIQSVSSDMENIKGQILTAIENLSFITHKDLSSASFDNPLEPPQLFPTIGDFQKKGENRSDILALRDSVLARRYGVKVAKAGHWPLVEVEGNYYLHRRGFLSEVDWDVILDVDVPIFQGGAVKSTVREYTSLLKEAELKLIQTERQVQRDIKNAYTRLLSTKKQVDFLEQAAQKAQKSYDLHTREYRLGLVNNLEVLTALKDLEDIELKLNQAKIQNKLDYLSLLIATEEFEVLKQ